MTGKASEASEAIERWLAARPKPDDSMDAALVQMRRTLRRLTEATLIRGDSRARRLMDELARCEDMEAFSASLDLLDGEVAQRGVEPARGAGTVQPAPKETRSRSRTLLRL